MTTKTRISMCSLNCCWMSCWQIQNHPHRLKISCKQGEERPHKNSAPRYASTNVHSPIFDDGEDFEVANNRRDNVRCHSFLMKPTTWQSVPTRCCDYLKELRKSLPSSLSLPNPTHSMQYNNAITAFCRPFGVWESGGLIVYRRYSGSTFLLYCALCVAQHRRSFMGI